MATGIIMASSTLTCAAATGFKARAGAIFARVAPFPLVAHQLLFRLAIAGVFPKASGERLADTMPGNSRRRFASGRHRNVGDRSGGVMPDYFDGSADAGP